MSVKLTRFSHGGGCGCKMSPAVLAEFERDGFAPEVIGLMVAGVAGVAGSPLLRVS